MHFSLFPVLQLKYVFLYGQAVTQNRQMASSMGIATSRVDALTFGLGSGIAGIAGVALSQIGNVSPNLGQLYIVDSGGTLVAQTIGYLAVETGTGSFTAPNGDIIVSDDSGATTIYRVTQAGVVTEFLSEEQIEAVVGQNADILSKV